MINPFEVIETIKMVDEENLDIRTITMGISLKAVPVLTLIQFAKRCMKNHNLRKRPCKNR